MEDIAKLTYNYEKKIDKIDCVLKLIEQIVDDNNLSFGAFTENDKNRSKKYGK